MRWLVSLALIGAIVAVVLLLAANRAQRGTGAPPGTSSKSGLVPVSLAESAANGYNPFGTGPENRDQIGNVVDSDPSTTWTTETYYEGNLRKPGGTGLGIYLDAAPGVAARAIAIQTPTPGFAAQFYVADHIDLSLPYGSSQPLSARGWVGPIGSSTAVRDGRKIALRPPPGAHRYYLIWLTTLPPGQQSATIADVTLFR